MAQRRISILTDDSISDIVDHLDKDVEVDIIEHWSMKSTNDLIWHDILLDAEDAQNLIDAIQPYLEEDKVKRMIVTNVETSLPLSKLEKKQHEKKEDQPWFFAAISREELYENMLQGSTLNANYIALTVLAALVASAALLDDNIAVLIGAMMIAPLLGPNLAFGFSVVIGELRLLKQAARSGAIGIGLAILIPAIGGFILDLPTEGVLTQITRIGYDNILIAICSGIVGVLTISQTNKSNLVGVMVAVALLPPAVATGLFLGAAEMSMAGHTGLLLAINVAGISIASQLTFYALGIKPEMQNYLKEQKAESVFHRTLWISGALMIIFMGVVFWIR